MLESRSERGAETDGGVTEGEICVAGHHLHACKNVCVCVVVCMRVDEGLEEERGEGVTVIYVVTYQMKQEGCVNQRVNTQLDRSIHPLSMCASACTSPHTISCDYIFKGWNHSTICAAAMKYCLNFVTVTFVFSSNKKLWDFSKGSVHLKMKNTHFSSYL